MSTVGALLLVLYYLSLATSTAGIKTLVLDKS